MKVLILGANGQLGRELQQTVPPECALSPLDRGRLDITDPKALDERIRTLRPHLIINAAAYTAVDRAEAEPHQALRVNAHAVAHLAEAAGRCDSRVIHVSTDYVFDGSRGTPYRSDDIPSPLNVYGKTKLEGERRLLQTLGPKALVLRTAWLYSRYGKNFVLTMLQLMRERSEVRVVSDQISTPTWARGLAHFIWLVARRPERSGVCHWTDAGAASWYDFAVVIQREAIELGILRRAVPVLPVRSDEYSVSARRPPFSVLDKTETWREFSMVPQHWSMALRDMLRELD